MRPASYLSGETRPGSVNVTASYDGYGRLTGYTRTGQSARTMVYNGNDERVVLTTGTASCLASPGAGTGACRRFIHDPDGRIIGEYTGGPTTPIAEYIWLLPETGDAGESGGDDGSPLRPGAGEGNVNAGWHPLAVVTANGSGGASTLRWLHSNHLGTPVRASTATGASAALTGFTLPGVPGQLQTLPDLYYNQHRDYDPTTGRYIQADPIGLAGDANPYVYAGASPMRFVDEAEPPLIYAAHCAKCSDDGQAPYAPTGMITAIFRHEGKAQAHSRSGAVVGEGEKHGLLLGVHDDSDQCFSFDVRKGAKMTRQVGFAPEFTEHNLCRAERMIEAAVRTGAIGDTSGLLLAF